MPVNFRVICDAATVTGKTTFHIRISEILWKTTLFLHFLKQIGKGKGRATGIWETVIFEMVYYNAIEHSFSIIDPPPCLGQEVNIL